MGCRAVERRVRAKHLKINSALYSANRRRAALPAGVTCLLSADAVIFLRSPQQEVIVAHRDEVDIQVKGKVMLSSKQKGTLFIKKAKYAGNLTPESYEKIEAWLKPDDVAEVEAVED